MESDAVQSSLTIHKLCNHSFFFLSSFSCLLHSISTPQLKNHYAKYVCSLWQRYIHKHALTFAEDKSNLTFARSICSEKNVQVKILTCWNTDKDYFRTYFFQHEVCSLQAMASMCSIIEVYIHVAPCCIIVASQFSRQTLIHRSIECDEDTD